MYLQYYGLKRKPFELAPNAETLFLGEAHKEGLAVLKYGLISEKGFLLLTGGVGTGKTTLVNALTSSLEQTANLCLISNPNLALAEFYYYFAAKIGGEFDGNKATFLLYFAEYLKQCQRSDRKILLIIDEAHVLPVELLEEIRLLANLAAEHPGSLSIFLVGQPELLERLAEKRLLPLRQRIALRFHLEPLSRKDTLQYIHFRLRVAGIHPNVLFTEKAVDAIHRAANGNPRVINIICDNALLTGYARNTLRIDHAIIGECVELQQLPGDEMFYSLSQGKKMVPRGLFWVPVFVICLVSVGVWFAFRFGFLDNFWHALLNILKRE